MNKGEIIKTLETASLLKRPLTLALLAMLAVMFAVPSPALAGPDGLVWNQSVTGIQARCDAEVAHLRARIADIIRAKRPRTFSNTILQLENANADLNDRLAVQAFLYQVSTDQATRDASLACWTDENDAISEISADPRLYAAVKAAAAGNTAKSVYDRKLTELWITTFKRSGAGLNTAKRKELVDLQSRLTDLQNRYQQNLGEDTSSITIDTADAAGIPADVLAGYEKTATGYTVPVNESTTSFMQYARSEAPRKLYYIAYNDRAAVPNTALLEQAIAVRDRLAHLLGYETWADYQLADHMAQTPARVEKFLANLTRTIAPKSQSDAEELRSLKAAETHDPQAQLEPWDTARYENILKQTRYAIDAERIRQYFPLHHTVDAILNVYHQSLGVDFTPVRSGEAWLPDVIEYRVSDSSAHGTLGYMYLDLYERPGKYSEFASIPLLPAREVHGRLRPRASIVIANWTKPAAGQDVLLRHQDVETLFHELADNIASLVVTAPYETLATGYREDFVEAPSQMFENFAWQPSILKSISYNAANGEPLPDDLIAKIVESRYSDYAYTTTKQILYALVDLRYHSMGPHVDTTAVWTEAVKELPPLLMYPGTHPQASFDHLMGGYDAGYYGYLWSEVYAQDLFTAFAQDGLTNPQVGMRFRNDLLAPARAYEPDTEVQNFLGRPMTPDAFYADFKGPGR